MVSVTVPSVASQPFVAGAQAPFVQRLIDVQFSLASGTFDNGLNSVTLSGLRVSAHIINAGGYSTGELDMEVYGMTLPLMSKLSTLGMVVQENPRNVVTVTAGNKVTGMGIVFIGDIMNAWADFQGAPEVPFRVSAKVLAAAASIPYSPSSFNGSTDVATILSGLATAQNLRFENNGVSQQLSKPYLWGSARQQMIDVIKQAGIESNMGEGGTLSIWPKNSNRGGSIPLISPTTGMIGYPSYTAQGIMVRSLYNPSIGIGAPGAVGGAPGGGAVQLGGLIQLQSSIVTTGQWKVYGLDHILESQVPHGQWFSTIKAYNPKYPQPALS